MAMNATSVVPKIVAIDNISSVTTELSLLRLAEHVGPVQVALLFFILLLFIVGHWLEQTALFLA